MSGLAPLPLRGERALVLGFDRHTLACDLSQAEATLVLASGLPELCEVRRDWRGWSALFDGRAAAFAPSALVVCSLRSAGPGLLLAALALGPRRVLLVEAPGTFHELSPRAALALCSARSLRRGLARLPGAALLERAAGHLLDPPWPTTSAAIRVAEGLAAAPPARARPRRPGAVLHYVGGLGPGGAERQLTYLAAATRAAGREVRVLSASPLGAAASHYLAELRAAGVEVASLAPARRDQLDLWREAPEGLRADLAAHPAAPLLAPLVAALRADRPEVLHCWLDQPNLVGALAGLLAGVPRVVISARNLSPRALPRLDEPWFQPSYRALSERVTCLANSRAGAEDYAAWSETPLERWEVIHNGFDLATCQPRTPEERAALRQELGVSGPLVVGVFRLEAEKRPLDFVALVARLRERFPDLRALHVGEGSQRGEVEAAARARGLGETLSFLGRRADPWRVLGAADLSLLTSEVEGLPNVVLESQALEVPVVATAAGGTAEALAPGESGAVLTVGDVAGLADAAARLLADPALRRAWGQRGRAYVGERFGLERMLAATLARY